MARIHLSPLATGFFSAFDNLEATEDDDGNKDNSSSAAILAQLRKVLTPSTAFAGYICFSQLLGGSHLESCLTNLSLIRNLVLQHQSSLQKPQHRPVSFLELQGVPQNVGGNFRSNSYTGSGTSGN